jgi:membrane-bound metal-dependent hydrolase YbcI (DUF457 family)
MLLLALVFGVLIDVDHVLDYLYAHGPHLDLRTFMDGQYEYKSKRVFVLLHAFEYLPLLYLFWNAYRGRKWAVAATAAMGSHIAADHLLNGVRPLSYFISYRLKHRFRAGAIIDPVARSHRKAYRAARRSRFKAGKATLADRASDLFI